MKTSKTTPSALPGKLLIDRDCARLDGKCDCKSIDECKYLKEKKEVNGI